MCEPRLSKQVEADLVNREAVLKRLAELSKKEADRYGDLQTPERLPKLIPSYYLLQYLNDVVNLAPGEKRRVSVRNKFFNLCFAEDKAYIIDLLEFPILSEGEERFVQLPSLEDAPPQPPQVTPFRSKRAWFEILRIHISFLLADVPSHMKPPIDVKAVRSTKESLVQLLDAKYTKTPFTNVNMYDVRMFDTLGVEKDMHESLLWYACVCQNQTNPGGREAVFKAISHVIQSREGACAELRVFLENEQIYWVTEASKTDAIKTKPISRAYRHLELAEDSTDVEVLSAFRSALKAASDAETARYVRSNTCIIGMDRKSVDIMQSVCTFDGPQDALNFIALGGVAEQTTSDPSSILAHLIAAELDCPAWFESRSLVAAAARVLAKNHGDDQALLDFAAAQEYAAKLPWFHGDKAAASHVKSVNYALPAGLYNLRNTCYLNSILQYLHTVIPVRDVIMDWEKFKLEPTEANIQARRLGGSGSTLDKGEVYLATKFVEEMRALFVDLQTTEASYVRPQQRLALAALCTPSKLVQLGSAEQAPPVMIGPLSRPNANQDLPGPPPPLPDRPCPKPPGRVQDPPAGPTVTVKSVSDIADTGSDVSSVTLVDQKDEDADQTNVVVKGSQDDESVPTVVPAKTRSPLEDDAEPTTRGRSATRERSRHSDSDVIMGGVDEPAERPGPEAAESLEDQINRGLNKTDTTGTDQQDVEEVMGNILEHLHAAIRPTGTDATTGKQTDHITETFYWRSRKYIRSVDLKTGRARSGYRTVDDLSRWMTAFPALQGTVDLYTALDSSFDQEFQEDGNETFTSITKLSLILHVYIQRSQNVDGRLGRNNNIVEIPQELALDRYMDGPSDSEVFRRRQRSWELKRRLKALDGRPTPIPSQSDAQPNVKETGFEVVNDDVDQYEEALLSIDNTGEGEGEDEYVSILDPETQKMLMEHALLPSTNGREVTMGEAPDQESQLASLDPESSRRLSQKDAQEKSKAQEELATLFQDDGMRQVIYRLHAVICHGGGLNAGHYWVWIYDFKKNMWRKHNDTEVSEYDNDVVMAELNSSGNPYYLAYVRSTEIDNMVAVPERIPPMREEPDDAMGIPTQTPARDDDGDGCAASDPINLERPSTGPGGGAIDDVEMDKAHVIHVEDRED